MMRRLGSWLVCVALALSLLVAFGVAAGAKEKVILDTDMVTGFDDGICMLMLAQSPNIDLLGVVCDYAHNYVEIEAAAGLRQLELIGRADIPVYMGCPYPFMASRVLRQDMADLDNATFGYVIKKSAPRPSSYLDLPSAPYAGYPVTAPQAQNGVDFIIDTVRANPGEVTICAIGAMTNIAVAIAKAPDLPKLAKRIVYMAATFEIPGNTSAAAEYNMLYDPEAAKIVFRAPWKEQVFNSLDIDQWYLYNKSVHDRIVAADTPVTRLFKDNYGARIASNPGWTRLVWDTITAAYLIDPTIITEIRERYVDVDTNYGTDYGRTWSYNENKQPAGTQKCKILWKLDEKRFFDLMVSLMTLPIANPINPLP